MTNSDSISQWDSLLLNLGSWKGSFTRLSPEGNLQDDIPTLVSLEGLNQNQTMRQTIQHFSSETGELIQNKVLEYSTLNRSTLFFENGAFSQGSIQFSPVAEFGAELGFIWGDRRLRLVQLFAPNQPLPHLTLIREHRLNTPVAERPPLTVDQLLGEWQGEAVTLYPDRSPPVRYSTTLSVTLESNDRLRQHLTAPQLELTSTAQINGSILLFDQGKYPVQVLLLPDGTSSNTPVTIPRGQLFVLEAGWLIEATLRQRMIRSYDAQGRWSSLTLITERNTSST
jgi:hypothetical protein